MGIFRGDFWIGIGHGEDDRIGSHAGNHLFGEGSFDRETEQYVGSIGGFFQGPEVGVGSEELLVGVHPLHAPLVDDPLGVAHDHVVRLHAEGNGQLGAGVGGSSGTIDDDADIFDILADEVQGINQGG